MNPKFSILMPTYNQANYLVASIQSILSQSYENWELIIINDGSTDNTQDIIETFNDQRIKYLIKENGGTASALNLGLEEIQGDFVCWLSSDDFYLEDKLQTDLDYLELHPDCQFLHSAMYCTDDKVSYIGELNTPNQLELPPPELQTSTFFIHNYVNTITTCISRELYNRAGTFNISLKSGHDYEMWLRMSLLTELHFNEKRTSVMRIHNEQMTASIPFRISLDAARFLNEYLNHYRFEEIYHLADLEDEKTLQLCIKNCLIISSHKNRLNFFCTIPLLSFRLKEWIDEGNLKTETKQSLYSYIKFLSFFCTSERLKDSWYCILNEKALPFSKTNVDSELINYLADFDDLFHINCKESLESTRDKEGTLKLTLVIPDSSKKAKTKEQFYSFNDFLMNHQSKRDFFLAPYIKARLQLLNISKAKIAIFGAGQHTLWLENFSEAWTLDIKYLVDDRDISESILGKKVTKPEEININEINTILISSDTFEKQLAHRCFEEFGDKVEVIQLYKNMPPGPYSKF